MRLLAGILIAGCLSASQAGAAEGDFLNFFNGNWSGSGSVKVTTTSPTVSVSCKFGSKSTSSSLSFDGNCRGLVVVSRQIKADLRAKGSNYTGTYIGSTTGPAGLSGRRSGNAINLGISWAKDVNGDRKAQLSIQKVGNNGMRLTVTDLDPKTGKSVVTSRIDLQKI
jgi:hypothetical protein